MRQFGLQCALISMGFAAACGEVKTNNLPDAPPIPDAGAPIDAAPQPVKATVLSVAGDGVPDTTAKIVFQDATGAMVFDAQADVMGRAQSELPAGGSVTAIRVTMDTPTALAASITTITGVKPGDDLVFGAKARGTVVNQGGATMMTANFPANGSADTFAFYTACARTSTGAGTTSVTLSFRDSCHGNTFDLIGVASGVNLPIPQFIRVANVNYMSGGMFTIPGGFTTMQNFTVNMTGIPEVGDTLTLTRSSMIESTAVAPQSVGLGDPAGTLSATVPFPQGFGTRSQVSLVMGRKDILGVHSFDVQTAQLGTSLNVDLSKLELPWITDVAGTPTGVTWTTVTPGGTPDGMVTQWSGRWNDGTRDISITWRIAHPVTTTGMTLPKLPAAYAMFDPAQQTATVTPGRVNYGIVDYDVVPGYDEFRQMPETLTSVEVDSVGAFINMPFQRRLATIPSRLRL